MSLFFPEYKRETVGCRPVYHPFFLISKFLWLMMYFRLEMFSWALHVITGLPSYTDASEPFNIKLLIFTLFLQSFFFFCKGVCILTSVLYSSIVYLVQVKHYHLQSFCLPVSDKAPSRSEESGTTKEKHYFTKRGSHHLLDERTYNMTYLPTLLKSVLQTTFSDSH